MVLGDKQRKYLIRAYKEARPRVKATVGLPYGVLFKKSDKGD